MNGSELSSYKYVVLRYVHDRRTEEFVNLGVVLECPSKGYLGGMFDNSFSRVSRFFPGVSIASLRRIIKSISSDISQRANRVRLGSDMFSEDSGYFEIIWRQVLPRDDTALSWGGVKGGVTRDPERELLRIYERAVLRYKEPSEKMADQRSRLRGLFGEPLRAVVVQAIREATGCPDIKGRDGEYLSEKVLALAKDLLRSNPSSAANMPDSIMEDKIE